MAVRLVGREREQALLVDVVDDVRGGHGRALVVHGDPGIGKTALLSELTHAQDVQLITIRGVEFEAELPYAALYQVFATGRSVLAGLPATQAEALQAAMGLEPRTPERFLVAMAVLTLLSILGDVRPVLMLVDDAHWLDEASQQVLAFVSRRLDAEHVGIVFAVRSGYQSEPCFRDLPELGLGGLSGDAARKLLTAAADLCDRVRDELLATAAGNPLALQELPSALSARQRDGAEALPAVPLVTDRLERAFRSQVDRLPEQTHIALLIMALDDPRDPIPPDAMLPAVGGESVLEPAERMRLIAADDGRIDFMHPLVRAAVVHSASLAQRQDAHMVLAAALSAPEHRDRQVWHQALATVGPDEPTAAALVAAATRAEQRSGWGAAAKMFVRAAELTSVPTEKGRRWLQAAHATWQAGRVAETRELVERGLALADDDTTRGRLLAIRGLVEYGHGQVAQAARILADSARLLRAQDAERAAALCALAEHSGWVTGQSSGDQFKDAVESLAGFERWRQAGGSAPPLGAALRVWTETEQTPLPARTRHDTYEGGCQWYAQCVQNIHALGALGALSVALHQLAGTERLVGRWRQAAAHATEGLRLATEFGHPGVIGGLQANLALLTAGQGDLDTARHYAHDALAITVEREQRASTAVAYNALGELELLAGHPDVAYRQFRQIIGDGAGWHHAHAMACLTAMAHAADQAGMAADLLPVLDLYQRVADTTGVGWARGTVLGARAQLSTDVRAEELFEEALVQDWVGNPVELARLRVAYGRWLRRRHPSQAREPLRLAVADLDRFGAGAWAEQARRELRAAGEAAPVGRRRTGDQLSAQELQIARLAAAGLSNRGIGAQLFISPRTVGYHLYKVFPKLGISSRGQLSTVDLENG